MSLWLAVIGGVIIGSVITSKIQYFLINFSINEAMRKGTLFLWSDDEKQWRPFDPFRKK